jgi:pimeloyl-ACP methyl ester carboxylesterase
MHSRKMYKSESAVKAIKWSFVIRGVAIISLILFVVIPLAIYVLLAPVVAHPLYHKLIFQPTKYPAGDWTYATICGIKPVDANFKSDNGNKLHGLLYEKPGAKKTVLLSHGSAFNCSDRKYLIQKFLEMDCSILAYDYSGFGKSSGEASMEGICEDGAGAMKYLTGVKKLSLNNIIIAGESLGTLVAGRLASDYQCAGVILLCPLASLRSTACDMLDFLNYYPDFAFSDASKKLDNLVALKHSTVPKLLISGTADRLVKIKRSDELFATAAMPKTYIRIDGADHEDKVMMEDPGLSRGVKAFIAAL